MDFHLSDGIPAIVIPVRHSATPLLAWHGKDLGELDGRDVDEVNEYVQKLAVFPSELSAWEGEMRRDLGEAVRELVRAAVGGRERCRSLDADFKLDRAGILVVKYSQAQVKG